MKGFTGVVLAGGKSSRMGKDKSTLLFEGETFLQRSRRLLEDLGASTILISSNDNKGLPDIYTDCGPLSGIHAALHQTNNNLLIIPVDMPLITSAQLLLLLEEGVSNVEAAHYDRFPLPLYLANSKKVRSIIENILKTKANLSIRSLIAQVDNIQIPVSDSRVFSNVNTMEDYNDVISD